MDQASKAGLARQARMTTRGRGPIRPAGPLIGVLGLTIAILLPYTFTFRLSAATILTDHAGDKPTPVPKLLAFLARKLEEHHDANERIIGRLTTCFVAGCGFLIIETIALMTAI
jgi:hypothetical protein